ncbi:hypothetical protein O3P69_006929 [Scylla paramamosain]|uniref:Uncharacterized protein n=1 Tax=Scylla paramamosain TaxID=85552 RepID=A0AAW0U1K8_SCYPA
MKKTREEIWVWCREEQRVCRAGAWPGEARPLTSDQPPAQPPPRGEPQVEHATLRLPSSPARPSASLILREAGHGAPRLA